MSHLMSWVAISHLQEVSVAKLNTWLNYVGDFDSLFMLSADELKAQGFTDKESVCLQKINWQRVEEECAWVQKHAQLVTRLDSRYPGLLKEIADPPLVLYAMGDVSLLQQPQIALVGSRKPTPMGAETAEWFAKGLAESGLVITSGLASGIDGACHRGALAAKGKTIAVMGTGLSEIYPRHHEVLAREIEASGLLVTEFPLHTRPTPWNFPRRNRIISGLSLGVVVVEAALKSGSLITARFAAEQNREVFAIPGSLHNPLAKGCHRLINQGAKLVESIENILEELKIELRSPSRSPDSARVGLMKQEASLLQKIDYAVTSLEVILDRCRLTPTEVSSILLSLELAGYVCAVPGGYIRSP